MLNNKGFSNILVISIVLVLLGVGGYFGFKYFQNPGATKSAAQDTDNKAEPVKKEITAFKPTISDSKDYFEVIDSNSNKKISIKIPKNILVDTTSYYGDSVKPNTKKITTSENYKFDDYQGDYIYSFIYTPKLAIPQIQAQFGGCGENRIIINGYKMPYDNLLTQNRNDFDKFSTDFSIKDNKLNEKEFSLNGFKANTIDNLPTPGNGFLKTLIQVDNNYSIEIYNTCEAKKNGYNDEYINLYYQVLNSFTEIK